MVHLWIFLFRGLVPENHNLIPPTTLPLSPHVFFSKYIMTTACPVCSDPITNNQVTFCFWRCHSLCGKANVRQFCHLSCAFAHVLGQIRQNVHPTCPCCNGEVYAESVKIIHDAVLNTSGSLEAYKLNHAFLELGESVDEDDILFSLDKMTEQLFNPNNEPTD